jgi:hypothetical protein
VINPPNTTTASGCKISLPAPESTIRDTVRSADAIERVQAELSILKELWSFDKESF